MSPTTTASGAEQLYPRIVNYLANEDTDARLTPESIKAARDEVVEMTLDDLTELSGKIARELGIDEEDVSERMRILQELVKLKGGQETVRMQDAQHQFVSRVTQTPLQAPKERSGLWTFAKWVAIIGGVAFLWNMLSKYSLAGAKEYVKGKMEEGKKFLEEKAEEAKKKAEELKQKAQEKATGIRDRVMGKKEEGKPEPGGPAKQPRGPKEPEAKKAEEAKEGEPKIIKDEKELEERIKELGRNP